MLAKRWHLVSAFAGGCLCTGLLVVVLHDDQSTPAPSAREQGASTAAPVELTPPSATTLDQPSEDAATAPTGTAVVAAPAPPVDPADAGRSVAEVLAQLEASYRAGLAPPPSVVEALQALAPPAAVTPPPSPAPAAPSALAVAPPQPAAGAPGSAAATPAPVAPSASAVAVALADAPTPLAPSAAQPLAEDREARERAAYLASALQFELYQQQQLAMLQYLALIAQTSPPPPQGPSGQASPRFPPRRSPSFNFPLTNPSNPWGFDLPPTVLAK
jgi:hypothetical protein